MHLTVLVLLLFLVILYYLYHNVFQYVNNPPFDLNERPEFQEFDVQDKNGTIIAPIHPFCKLSVPMNFSRQVDQTSGKKRQGWLCKDGKPTSDVCCTWSGVFCDKNKFITSLDLQNFSLHGDAYQLLENAPKLKYLDLRGNLLLGDISSAFSKIEPFDGIDGQWVIYFYIFFMLCSFTSSLIHFVLLRFAV